MAVLRRPWGPIHERSVPPAITPAPTGTAAFLGVGGGTHPPAVVTAAGELHLARRRTSPLAHAVDAFFAHGGTRAWVAGISRATPLDVRGALERLDPDVSIAAIASARPAEPDLLTMVADEVTARGAMLLVEGPWRDAREAQDELEAGPDLALGLAGPDVALYWPRTDAPGGAMLGAIAGVIARTPVGEAPAGLPLTGAGIPAIAITTEEVSRLAKLGVNAIRTIESATVVWGARTLAAEREWKYVSVRRTFLHLERSIERGLGWVVFEPNDEPLWQRVRASVGDYLHGLFRAGQLQGAKPDEAFFVACDRTTMTQADVDAGRLVCVVGFAPIKPAEFVILSISHKTAGAR